MTLFQVLERDAPARGLDFLIIGAHAVNQYGYSRDTADVDLLVRRSEREAWLQLFRDLGYAVLSERETFLQLNAPPDFVWPVDLMFVNDQTWNKMAPEALSISIGDARCKVPGLLHLIALKIHALKHSHAGRFMKDFQDVEGLVKVNRLDIASRTSKRYLSAMERQTSTKKSRDRSAKIEAEMDSFAPQPPDLEFPVNPDFRPEPPHIDPVKMYWRCEELVRQGARKRDAKEREAQSIDVEFVM